MSLTPDNVDGAKTTAVEPLVTALMGDRIGTFLDIRGADTPEGRHLLALRGRGWRGRSVSATERVTLDEGGELGLLIVDDPDRLDSLLAELTAHSVEPWIIVTSSPASSKEGTPVIGPSYRHVLFDGTHDVFVATRQIALVSDLATRLSDWVESSQSVRRWRASALEGWQARGSVADAFNAQKELLAMKRTLSWRVTRPLRVVRRRMPSDSAS